jgi:hypothetical protein
MTSPSSTRDKPSLPTIFCQNPLRSEQVLQHLSNAEIQAGGHLSTSQSRLGVLIMTTRMDPMYVPTLALECTWKSRNFLATSQWQGRMSSIQIH